MPGYGHQQELKVGQYRNINVQQDLNRGFLLYGLKFQYWTLYIENVGGTIRHYFSWTDRDSGLLDRIHWLGTPGILANTPTVSSGTGFGGSGMGILSGTNYLLFDTIEPQDPVQHWGMPALKMYDGANVVPRVGSWMKTDNIGGVTKSRMSFFLANDMTGAGITVNTTFLPSGRRIAIAWQGFLK